MNFVVRWTVRARDQLAAVWLAYPDRTRVTAAAHQVDQRLAADPEGAGESRPGGRRIMFESPLAVTYRIDSARRRVIVHNIHSY